MLETIVRVSGTPSSPAKGITFEGVGFRDSTPTYLKKWGVPSGGDWALYRGGAVRHPDTLQARLISHLASL